MSTEEKIILVLRESPKALTVREIGEAVGLKSPGYVHSLLARMEARGLVRQERGFVLARTER